MLHSEGCSVMHQTQNVKAAGTIPGVMAAQPRLGGLAYMRPLGGRQGVSGASPAPRRPRLDFHKHQFLAVAGHHVQLHASIAPVSIQNPPALAPYKGLGRLLSVTAQRRRA